MSVGLIPPTNPAAGSGDQLLGIFSASAAATLPCATRNQGSYTGVLFQGDFDIYRIEIYNLQTSSAGSFLWWRASTDGGATYDSGANYDSNNWGWRNGGSGTGGGGAGQTKIICSLSVSNGLSTSASRAASGTFKITNPLSSVFEKGFEGRLKDYETTANVWLATDVMGSYTPATPVNAFQFLMSAGNITAVVAVYGIPKSASTGNTNVLSGTVVQVVNTQTGAVATGTTVIPFDDTIPQNTEGDQYMSLSITPRSATSKLKIDVVFIGSSDTGVRNLCVALFQDSTANAIAAEYFSTANAGYGCFLTFSHFMTAGTTSSTTFKVRAGVDTSGTITFNGGSSARKYGGVLASSITITEIAV